MICDFIFYSEHFGRDAKIPAEVFSVWERKAEAELLSAFKTRTGIIKKYALLVNGRVDITKIKRTVYLKKIENLSKVWISEVKTSGYDPIITEFEIVEYRGDKTILEANLLTGKTHQIRAHIAYYGYPIVGDNKYGKSNEKQLHLTANFLKFNFKKDSLLAYLNMLPTDFLLVSTTTTFPFSLNLLATFTQVL